MYLVVSGDVLNISAQVWAHVALNYRCVVSTLSMFRELAVVTICSACFDMHFSFFMPVFGVLDSRPCMCPTGTGDAHDVCAVTKNRCSKVIFSIAWAWYRRQVVLPRRSRLNGRLRICSGGLCLVQ